jgi:hypothetical protein
MELPESPKLPKLTIENLTTEALGHGETQIAADLR